MSYASVSEDRNGMCTNKGIQTHLIYKAQFWALVIGNGKMALHSNVSLFSLLLMHLHIEAFNSGPLSHTHTILGGKHEGYHYVKTKRDNIWPVITITFPLCLSQLLQASSSCMTLKLICWKKFQRKLIID